MQALDAGIYTMHCLSKCPHTLRSVLFKGTNFCDLEKSAKTGKIYAACASGASMRARSERINGTRSACKLCGFLVWCAYH